MFVTNGYKFRIKSVAIERPQPFLSPVFCQLIFKKKRLIRHVRHKWVLILTSRIKSVAKERPQPLLF